ncbi:MAG: DUF1697 domain-containing protein [Proteobacteria bacterium]|nr:DUF1697 domain-containing protein [Pseudomonadota bacterium]
MKAAILLRAINVGGRKLLMADFKAALAKGGFEKVQTIGAAGTAMVEAATKGETLEAEIEKLLKAECRMEVEVFVRDHGQMAEVVAGNPFKALAKAQPNYLAVSFLKAGAAGKAEVVAVREKIAGFGGPEEVEAGPGCLYLSYPDGQGQSKLTPVVIERATKLRGTARNWNTVTKLAELTRG